MKLGIVGSSHSVGMDTDLTAKIKKTRTMPFEHWFKNIDVVNSACDARGTELYLSKVLYLKQNHNIDTLLLEVINNRSMFNVKTKSNNYKIIYNKLDINNVLADVYKNHNGMSKYQDHINVAKFNYAEFGTKKEFNAWNRFQTSIAADCTMNEFWAMCDIKQTINLCKILNIRVVAWTHYWSMEHIPIFNSVIQDATYIKFPEAGCAFKYYKNKYGEHNIKCDHVHFNNKTNEEMVNDFILPALLIKNN
jgi:hypothetical protein